MDITESTIRDRCTDAVFERGQTYRDEGRIQRIERYGDVVTAAVSGSQLYDVTIDLDDEASTPHCTCPYDGPGDCKHVVAVLLKTAVTPPTDESERVEAILDDVPADDLRAFVTDALATDRDFRDRFLARFGDTTAKTVDEYRPEVDRLFAQHTADDSVVTEAIDFSQLFDVAEEYRTRDEYQAAATVYRALFEGIDDNIDLVDAAYDHYARAFQTALDGYVDCVLATDSDAEAFESYADVVAERASTGAAVHRERFQKALGDLEARR
ncbi:SWIM zinc finger domain-containing protein [Halorientalis brevis]|uniref:SWIM zinc finger domain-containing protein n=1 Tax=Halorientalis brevis TaxID=1126241 RepID=A0ABD6CAB3_9EURY|nr:SWIM zinc finger family protein [Halorientalis brevis]